MNKVKFRVWDKKNKEWATDFVLSLNGNLLCDNGLTLFIKNDMELMQWTGLQDTNGIEIYEGDIIQYEHEDEFGNITFPKVLIKWGTEYAGFRAYDIPDINGVSDIVNWVCYNPTQVIGNIYENPELLTLA